MSNSIHSTAVIDPLAKISDDTQIGAFVVIEGIADIMAGVSIEPFTIIRGATIGANAKIFSHAVIENCTLGTNVTIGQGVRIERGVNIGDETRIWHHSVVLKEAQIGKQCSFGQNVHIAAGVKIGNGAKVQGNIAIYEGVTLEDNVFLGPAMVFTNVTTPRADVNRKGEYAQTIVGEGATIGANATIVCGHTIGERSFVAAGALVTKDVPPRTLVISKAAAAKPVSPVCDCGEIPRPYDVSDEEVILAWRCGRCEIVIVDRPWT